jgi:hypothetical protein
MNRAEALIMKLANRVLTHPFAFYVSTPGAPHGTFGSETSVFSPVIPLPFFPQG